MKQTKTTPTAHIYAEIHGSTSAVEDAMNGIFDRFNDAFNCEFNDEDIFLAAVAPDIELCVVREDEANDYLPCYAEADTVEDVPALGLLACYHPAQVIRLAGRRYLCGTVLFTDVDEYGNTVSLKVQDIYDIQNFLAGHSTTLMADGHKLPLPICTAKRTS